MSLLHATTRSTSQKFGLKKASSGVFGAFSTMYPLSSRGSIFTKRYSRDLPCGGLSATIWS